MLYRTYRTNRFGTFVGFTQDVKQTLAFTAGHDFRRIVDAAIPDLQGCAVVQKFASNNWLRSLARVFFSGPRLRAILRYV